MLVLAQAGYRYLQFDDTNLAYLCDANMRVGVKPLGEDPDVLLFTYIQLLNNSIVNRPADMAITIHLCRGNAFSAHFAKGGYETVADHMFNLSKVEGFFLEYDDERSGDFSPLRFVPKDKKIVLGLASSKKPQLETRGQILRRIEEASKLSRWSNCACRPSVNFSAATTAPT